MKEKIRLCIPKFFEQSEGVVVAFIEIITAPYTKDGIIVSSLNRLHASFTKLCRDIRVSKKLMKFYYKISVKNIDLL